MALISDNMPFQRSDEMDRLRAVAIIFVVIHHTRFIHQMLPFPFLQKSWSGVDLFFVISGFVVTLSFFRGIKNLSTASKDPFTFLRNHRQGVLAFYLRRFLRIAPATALWIAIPYFFESQFNRSGAFTIEGGGLSEIVAILSMTFNYSTLDQISSMRFLWSLMVEEHFYLLLPIGFILLPSNKLRLYAAVVLMGGIAFVFRPFWAQETLSATWLAVRFHSHLRFDSLLAGVVLGLLAVEGALPILPATKSMRWIAGIITAISLFLLVYVPYALPDKYSHTSGFTVLWVASALLVTLAAQNKGFIFELPIIGNVLTFIGRRSFGIYLCHQWAQRLYQELAVRSFGITPNEIASSIGESWWRLAVTLLVMFIAAELTYRFIEAPCIRLGVHLSKIANHIPTQSPNEPKMEPVDKAA